MSVQEFYDIVGNYADIKTRLPESLMPKLIKMFLDDNSVALLEEGIKENDGEKAFRAVHTLKGVCLNLGFDTLSKYAIDLCEKLRDRKLENYQDEYDLTIKEYQKTIELIKQLD